MMNYKDVLTTDFTDTALQSAFRTYFGELGTRITNWDGLFAAMGEVGRDYSWTHKDEAGRIRSFVSGVVADECDHAFVRKDETGQVVGFIQSTTMDMSSWFFRAKCGFIREFWIRKDLRRQGHGGALLHQAENWLRAQGCICVLLTTDTAPAFYRKHGYMLQSGIQARNHDDVYLKSLT